MKDFKVRDKRNKGWFYLDNEYLNGIGKYVGPTGISVYVSLCRHANEEQSCFPAQDTIAKEIGTSDRSVKRYIKKLEDFNIIRIEKTRTSHGKWLNNTYYLLDKTEWKYPRDTMSYGNPRDKNDRAMGQKRQSHGTPCHTNNTNKNNTNKKKNSSSKKMYYYGMEMRKAQGKLWCIPNGGGEWLEFVGNKEDITYK